MVRGLHEKATNVVVVCFNLLHTNNFGLDSTVGFTDENPGIKLA